jgi:hypothetical protein
MSRATERSLLAQAVALRGSERVCKIGRQESWPAKNVTPNPSIERTPYGTLRVPPVAAHVER